MDQEPLTRRLRRTLEEKRAQLLRAYDSLCAVPRARYNANEAQKLARAVRS